MKILHVFPLVWNSSSYIMLSTTWYLLSSFDTFVVYQNIRTQSIYRAFHSYSIHKIASEAPLRVYIIPNHQWIRPKTRFLKAIISRRTKSKRFSLIPKIIIIGPKNTKSPSPRRRQNVLSLSDSPWHDFSNMAPSTTSTCTRAIYQSIVSICVHHTIIIHHVFSLSLRIRLSDCDVCMWEWRQRVCAASRHLRSDADSSSTVPILEFANSRVGIYIVSTFEMFACRRSRLSKPVVWPRVHRLVSRALSAYIIACNLDFAYTQFSSSFPARLSEYFLIPKYGE